VVLQWDISYGMQAILITLLSLVSIIGCYWFIIRKINILRVVFGMKKKAPKKTLAPQITFVNSLGAQLQPIMKSTKNSK